MDPYTHGRRTHSPPEIFTDDDELSGSPDYHGNDRSAKVPQPPASPSQPVKPAPIAAATSAPAASNPAPVSNATANTAPAPVVNAPEGDDDLVFPIAGEHGIADPWAQVDTEPVMAPPPISKPRPARTANRADKTFLRPPARPVTKVRDKDSERTQEDLAPETGGGWTLPMLCAGIAVIAITTLLPLAEENRQLLYQRERLKVDLTQVKQQVTVNDDFLKRIQVDPNLAERLAQRQMKTIRQGEAVLDLGASDKQEMSPFLLVTVPPPVATADYRPLGGALAGLARDPRTRLLLNGIALFLILIGLVFGSPWRASDKE